jgi:hypothetical protein
MSILGVYLICFCIGCDKTGDKSQNKEMSKDFTNKWVANLAKPDQEIVALLAVKYGKDLGIIETIVDTYLTETDFVYKQFKSTIQQKDKEETKQPVEFSFELFVLDKSAYADKVAQISSQFSLDPAVVASILIDYKIWKAAESRPDSE